MEPATTSVDAIAISVAVVTLVQLLKWGLIPDKYGPIAVMTVSALGVAAWGYSKGPMWDRGLLWDYVVAWILVSTSAAGIYGFTRAAAASMARMTPPPHSGAGSEKTK